MEHGSVADCEWHRGMRGRTSFDVLVDRQRSQGPKIVLGSAPDAFQIRHADLHDPAN
jgi:hypothetical protein